MFNKNVIDVLTQVNGVTNSIILKYPKTVAVSESQDILLLLDISALDDTPFPEIGLKDSLSDFLNLFKLFPDDRTVQIDGNTVDISAGKLSSSYIMDNIALMDSYNKDAVQFEKTQEVPDVATFVLTTEDIKNIKSASGVFKDLSEVLITSQDGEVQISLGATNKFNAKSNKFSISKPTQATKEFEIKIPIDNFKMLPSSEYNLHVKYNSARDSYRILMQSTTLNGFMILMSVKV